MQYFKSQGLRIAYDDDGEGDPIILLHGFAADRRNNWRLTGWTRLLASAGFRVIAPDARGHGRSDKPTDPADYAPEGIAGDAIRLMDHLGIDTADVFGYSMGGRNAAWLLATKETRLSSVIIGGVGENLLESKDAKSPTVPKMVPIYEKNTKSGRARALSACLHGSFPGISRKAFAEVHTPTLVIAGSRDLAVGNPLLLADAIPHAKGVIVPGRTHLSVIADSFFKGAVMGFLGYRNASRSLRDKMQYTRKHGAKS
jgi:pimeloyl-ACP methyl ester carboxylesterase